MATKTYKIVIDVESGDVKQLEKELSGVKGEIKSIDQQVAGLDIDQKFKAAAGGIKVMAGALAGAVGTLGLLGVESDKFGEFEKKAASAIAVAIGFRDIAEGLNEMRVALQGVTVAQLKANAAALANPYVLLAAAVAGLVAGFAKLASVLTDNIVGPFESFVNMVKSLGNPFKFAALQAKSYAENLAKIDNEKAISALERSVKVLQAFGQDTIDLEIDLAERRLKALEEGSEEYEKAFTDILVLRAKKAKGIQDKEIKDAEDAAKKKADAELKAYNKRLEELKFEETLDKWRKQDEAAFEALGDEAAITFTDAFNKTVKKEFDPSSIFVMEDDDGLEEELFGPDGVITNYQNGLQEAIDKTIANRETWQNFVNLASEAFANIEMLSQQRYERTLVNLQRERDEILNNTSLTEQAKTEALERLEKKEREVEIKRIKAERDQFTLKQTLLIAEEVMKAKSYAMEQIQIARLNVAKAQGTAQEIALAGVAATGKAAMSLGAFVAALGPFGIAAFALSIGGVIASIVAARKKAKAQIAAIGAQGAAGGGTDGGAPTIPQAVTQQQPPQTQLTASPTVRAYVLSGDARSAQEADAKLAAKRSLG